MHIINMYNKLQVEELWCTIPQQNQICLNKVMEEKKQILKGETKNIEEADHNKELKLYASLGGLEDFDEAQDELFIGRIACAGRNSSSDVNKEGNEKSMSTRERMTKSGVKHQRLSNEHEVMLEGPKLGSNTKMEVEDNLPHNPQIICNNKFCESYTDYDRFLAAREDK